MLTDKEKENLIRLRRDGASWKSLASEFGISTFTAKAIAEPGWRQHRQEQVNIARRRREAREQSADQSGKRRVLRPWQGDHRAGRVPKDEFLRASATIPPDTRGLTQRLFGDPLPGRSALDQRQEKMER